MNRSELEKRLVRALPAIAAVVFVFATVATAHWLYRGAPDLQRAPGWFYQWVNKGSFDMLLVAASAALLPSLVRTSFRWARAGFWRATGCIVVGSLLLQLATGIIARIDVKGWTERFYVGHGEFTERAKVVTDAIGVLRNYERLALQNQLGLYGPSKPPGTYAVYFIIDRTSRWPLIAWLISPLAKVVQRDPGVWPQDLSLVTWTILVLGLWAALTAVPLCWLGRTLLSDGSEDERTWLYPAWLFASSPAINVISVHLDSTLFPLLAATCLASCVWSVRVGRSWPAAVGGVVGMLAVYCSYGNAPIFGLAVAAMLGMSWQTHGSLRASRWPLAALAGGALLVLFS
ncbi:MAG TPA: hypothetical protein VJR89_30110, partial [Polyangiales bacterium]|nr:hypothetical protein [Polyangiales bacterium]